MMSVPTVDQKYSSNEKMLATCWHGKGDIRVEQHPKPLITEAVSCLSTESSFKCDGSRCLTLHASLTRTRMP